jgi:hypothetical protein
MPAELAAGMLATFDPVTLAGAFAVDDAWTGATDQGVEEKNGVQARHFRIDSGTLAGTLASLPPGSSVDAWVAEDGGFLVALEIIGEGGKGFNLDITDLNDPSLTVTRPE